MRKLTRGRPLNRRQRRAFDQFRATSLVLLRLAEKSLELSEQQIEAAQDGKNETADMLQARVFELLELVHGVSDPATEQARAEIEERRGGGFLNRVAAMGRPAAEALAELDQAQLEQQRKASGLLRAAWGLLFAALLLLSPSAAKAASAAAAALHKAHKIQRRNFARLLPKLRGKAHHFRRRGWIRSKKSYATLQPRFTFSQRFAVGYARAPVSCESRASSSKSSWFGANDAFALGVYRVPIPTSQSSAPTGRSNVRRGASLAKGAAHANG